MKYSIYDEQCHKFLHSGLNSNTKKEAIEEALSFLFGGEDFSDKIVERITNEIITEQEEFIKMYELNVVSHFEEKNAGWR